MTPIKQYRKKPIKVVQIAYMGDDGSTEYLDDQGRVWYSYKSVWRQVELPIEPVSEDMEG